MGMRLDGVDGASDDVVVDEADEAKCSGVDAASKMLMNQYG